MYNYRFALVTVRILEQKKAIRSQYATVDLSEGQYKLTKRNGKIQYYDNALAVVMEWHKINMIEMRRLVYGCV